jgi:hypothetical protein
LLAALYGIKALLRQIAAWVKQTAMEQPRQALGVAWVIEEVLLINN